MHCIIVLHLLSDGRLVVFTDGRRHLFLQPICAAIFIQLLVNQLQVMADEHRSRTAAPHAQRSHDERRDPRLEERAGDAPAAA